MSEAYISFLQSNWQLLIVLAIILSLPFLRTTIKRQMFYGNPTVGIAILGVLLGAIAYIAGWQYSVVILLITALGITAVLYTKNRSPVALVLLLVAALGVAAVMYPLLSPEPVVNVFNI